MEHVIEVATGCNLGIDTRGAFIQIVRKPRLFGPDKVEVKIISKKGACHMARSEGAKKLRFTEYGEY
jgi:hypothetical protein